MSNFGYNEFGIYGKGGELITLTYVRAYIHCNCRIADGYDQPDRDKIIQDYMNNLESFRGMSGNEIGKKCSLDKRWAKNQVGSIQPAKNQVESSQSEYLEFLAWKQAKKDYETAKIESKKIESRLNKPA